MRFRPHGIAFIAPSALTAERELTAADANGTVGAA